MEVQFENMTQNSTFDPSEKYHVSPYLATELAMLSVSILASISNILIVYAVFKSPALHTRTFLYIANWCICNAVITLSAPTAFNLMGFAEILVNAEMICIWNENLFVFLLGNLIFVAILLVDWYVMTFSGQRACGVRCRNSYRAMIASVWIFLFMCSVLTTSMCFGSWSFPVSVVLYLLGYVIVFTLMLIIFVLKIIKSKTSSVLVMKRKFEFYLVLSYFFCWLPNMVFLIFLFSRMHAGFSNYALTTIEHITYLLGYGHAIILLILLYSYQKAFKSCFTSIFRCDSSKNNGCVVDREVYYDHSVL